MDAKFPYSYRTVWKLFLFGLESGEKYQMSVTLFYCMQTITSTVLAATIIH